MTRRLPALLTVCAISAAALGGGRIAASTAAGRTVTLTDIAFSPRSISIPRGTKVTFAFRDGDTTHNVTSTGRKRFRTIADRSRGAQVRSFTHAGTYRYECTLHPGMTGRIIVH